MIMKNKLKKQTRDISNSTFIHCSKYFYFKSYIDFGCYVNVFIVMTQHLYSISYFLNKNESNLMFHKYNRYIFNYSFIIQYITIAIK